MRALTPSERRGAAIVVLLLALGAARDLIVAGRGVLTPPPAAESGSAALEPARVPGDSAHVSLHVDLNRADAEELDRLPGIGPVLARRIVDQRARAGPFRSVDELRAVRGVGPRLLERLRPWVVAGPMASPAQPAAPSRADAPSAASVQTARKAARGAADSAQVRRPPDR